MDIVYMFLKGAILSLISVFAAGFSYVSLMITLSAISNYRRWKKGDIEWHSGW